MTLEELNNQIHAITNEADMSSELATIKANIKAALLAAKQLKSITIKIIQAESYLQN